MGKNRKPRKNWGFGLPVEILAIVGQGSDAVKHMRELNSHWKAGFDAGVTTIRVGKGVPLLPITPATAEQFPLLSKLILGQTGMKDTACLAGLASFRHLTSLSLGCSMAVLESLTSGPKAKKNAQPRRPRAHQPYFPFGRYINDSGLEHLRGLPLTELDLEGCQRLTDAGLASSLVGMPLRSLNLGEAYWLRETGAGVLAGLPLTSLSLRSSGSRLDAILGRLAGLHLVTLDLGENCEAVSGEALEHLRGMPLADLSLRGCHHLEPADLAVLRALPLTKLDLGRSGGVMQAPVLEYLRGKPLTDLNLEGCRALTDAGLQVLFLLSPLLETTLLSLIYCLAMFPSLIPFHAILSGVLLWVFVLSSIFCQSLP